MAEHADVLIVGGGVIGLTTAYFLGREGVAVTVLDRGDLGRQASWAGAGIIPPGNPEHTQTPYDRLRAHSSRMYPALSAELRARTGIDNGFLVCGGIELVGPGDEDCSDEWRGEGIDFEELDRAGLKRSEPGLEPGSARGYFLPGMAQVRNPRHVKALLAACSSAGVRLLAGCAAHSLVRQGSRLLAVDTDQGRWHVGRCLLAAGAWSEPLLESVGWRPGIRPVRGQIALLETGAGGVRPVLLHGKRYLVPRPDGRVLVGSTEEEAGFDTRTTAAAIAGLLTFASGLVPGLARASLERCWAGLRPGSPDGLPYLGPVPGCNGLFVAAGHFRSGIQLSPGSGLVMKELLLGQEPSLPLEAFRLERPPGPPVQAAFRS